MIQVKCTLYDCLHYHVDPDAPPPRCRCSHPDKKFYMEGARCPLYRLDWSKQAEKAMSIQNRMRNGG